MPNVFARLEKLSSRLNESSDSLNESIKRVEDKFASLRLGVSAWLSEPLKTEMVKDNQGNLEDELTTYLGYAKIDGSWRLFLREDSAHYCDIEESGWPSYQALKQAPRDLRVKALQRLPELIIELEKGAEVALEEVEKARLVARTISDSE